jgi:hypothetical protein
MIKRNCFEKHVERQFGVGVVVWKVWALKVERGRKVNREDGTTPLSEKVNWSGDIISGRVILSLLPNRE